MDILAHTLWASIGAKAANKRIPALKQSPLHLGWAAFWGVAPDLFAFTIPFVWMFWQHFVAGEPAVFIRPGAELTGTAVKMLHLSQQLYHISHSAVIFALVFAAVWLIRGKPGWELAGWLLHILIDLPTHTEAFFPTPVLWPISNWHFTHGLSWATPWFMALNYTAIIIAFAYFFGRKWTAR